MGQAVVYLYSQLSYMYCAYLRHHHLIASSHGALRETYSSRCWALDRGVSSRARQKPSSAQHATLSCIAGRSGGPNIVSARQPPSRLKRRVTLPTFRAQPRRAFAHCGSFTLEPTWALHYQRLGVANYSAERQLLCPGHCRDTQLDSRFQPAVFPQPGMKGFSMRFLYQCRATCLLDSSIQAFR